MSPLITTMAASPLRTVRAGVQELDKNLAPSVWVDLGDQLKSWLSKLLDSALSARLAIVFSSKELSDKDPNVFSIHAGFTASEVSPSDFFQFLPGAKETVDLVLDDWINAQSLMLSRLHRDWNRLSPILPRGSRNRLKHVTPGLSDPHDHGQTVTMLEFSSGEHIVYKPRGCEGEQIWFSALEWLNREGFRISFQIPDLISRRNYCWMSYIEHRGCQSIRAIRRFYFRWGAQAAIAQLLGCADLHRQNWIASGEHPVLIDAEMLGDAFSRRKPEDADRHLHPLLRTGLLPLFANDGVAGYSGIAPFDPSGSEKEAKTFWPIYRGRSEPPAKYVGEIVEGFVAACRIVCDSRCRKVCEQLITQAAHRASLRVLKRATIQYRRILDESLRPVHMQKGGQRLSYLLKRCGGGRIDAIEARCLFRCSVPRFIKNTTHSKTRRSVPKLSSMLESQNVLESRLRGGKD